MPAQGLLVPVATFALSTILNTDLIKDPALWNDSVLTPAGKAIIQSTTLDSFLASMGGAHMECPFRLPDRPCKPKVTEITGLHWANLYDFIGLDNAIAAFFLDGVYFHGIFNLFLIGIITTALSFFLLHRFWQLMARLFPRTCLATYTRLLSHDQTILCTHSTFVLLLGLQMVPYSYFAINALFGPDFASYLQRFHAPFFAFVLQHGLLYVVEASTRSIIKYNSLLLWHHIIWVMFIIIFTYSRSVFALKLNLVLDWMVVFEALLYAGLVSIRLGAPWQVIRAVLVVASVLYWLSRIVQTVILVAFFAKSHARMVRAHDQPVYWAGVILSAALTVLQGYTGMIYYRLYVKAGPLATGASPYEDEMEELSAAGEAGSQGKLAMVLGLSRSYSLPLSSHGSVPLAHQPSNNGSWARLKTVQSARTAPGFKTSVSLRGSGLVAPHKSF